MAEANITKNSLAQSMKKLMSEKSFSKISITDICEGCGMNRKSFYYHFKDKYDLMNWIFYSDFICRIGPGSYGNGWELLEAVCDMFYQDQGFYRSAFKTEGQNSFKEYLLESMLPIFEFLFEDVWADMEFGDMIGKMICDIYILAVTYWLNSGCKVAPKDFVGSVKELLRRISIEGDQTN